MDLKLFHNIGLLIIRVGMGSYMFFGHGMGKLAKFNDLAGQFPDPLGVGNQNSLLLVVFSEVGCAILLALGFLTRLATIPLIITMAVAAFVIHAEDPWNKMEMSVLYLTVFTGLLLTGGGRFSIDEFVFPKIFGKKK